MVQSKWRMEVNMLLYMVESMDVYILYIRVDSRYLLVLIVINEIWPTVLSSMGELYEYIYIVSHETVGE